MTISDKIQLIGIIVSSTISLIAIIISVLTLRQNSRMIRESTRPNILIYSKYSDGTLYLIIKNFGNSAAYIDNIETNFFISATDNYVEGNPFSNLIGHFFPPNYSQICPLIGHLIANENYHFKITYHSSTSKYSDTFSINPLRDQPFPDVSPSPSGIENSVKKLVKIFHELFKNNL
ncbi:MAG: hypothetical protein RR571_08910 [Anaerorhabdus sp.]